MAHPLFRNRSVQVLLVVFAIGLAAFCIYDFVGMVRLTRTKAVQRDFVTALQRMQSSPPGVERVDDFVRDLKAIKTDYAPEDVKSALRDYTDALEQSLNALKSGRDTSIYDPVIAHAKDKLIESVAKHDPEFADAVSRLQSSSSR